VSSLSQKRSNQGNKKARPKSAQLLFAIQSVASDLERFNVGNENDDDFVRLFLLLLFLFLLLLEVFCESAPDDVVVAGELVVVVFAADLTLGLTV
jgi:hypothetical protein